MSGKRARRDRQLRVAVELDSPLAGVALAEAKLRIGRALVATHSEFEGQFVALRRTVGQAEALRFLGGEYLAWVHGQDPREADRLVAEALGETLVVHDETFHDEGEGAGGVTFVLEDREG